MRKGIIILGVFMLCVLAGGCVFPGSGIGSVRINGRLLDASGQGIGNEQIHVLLSKEYGLAGLDAKWGKPEDYGHRDQRATLTTDNQGRFEHAFDATTYSVSYWLLPPLGPFPRKPPAPFFSLMLPAQRDEFWMVWMKKKGPEAKLVVKDAGKLLDQSQNVPTAFSGELIWEKKEDMRGYLVNLDIRLLPTTGEELASEADK